MAYQGGTGHWYVNDAIDVCDDIEEAEVNDDLLY